MITEAVAGFKRGKTTVLKYLPLFSIHLLYHKKRQKPSKIKRLCHFYHQHRAAFSAGRMMDFCSISYLPLFSIHLLYHKKRQKPSKIKRLCHFYHQHRAAFSAGRMMDFCSISRPSMSHRNCCQEIGLTSLSLRGHLKLPFSKRLYRRRKPSPSHKRHLILSSMSHRNCCQEIGLTSLSLRGHLKLPFSKRLYRRRKPSPSHKRHLILSLRFPQNRKRLLEKGSRWNCSCTITARPSMDLRISV